MATCRAKIARVPILCWGYGHLARSRANEEPRPLSCVMSPFLALLQVFQTFACDDYHEIGKRYLRADSRIECDTTKHMAYRVYAGVMVALCKSFSSRV